MIKKREHWSSSLGFILAAAGSAVGLGSLWRFPYYTGENGGGLFVLFYVFFTFIVGIPVFLAELIIGRNSQKSPVGALSELSKFSHAWKSLGWLCVFSSFIILSFYSVVAGWGLNYALMSMCQFTENHSSEEIRKIFDALYQSGDINLLWHFVFMLMTVGIVYGGVREGIERWSRILMPALFFILFGLFLYSATLPGFEEAWQFILYPDFSKFGATSALKALGMSFFTLSLGLGIVLTYGSYMKTDENLPKTALIISLINVSVSIIASLMIFPIIFSFGFSPEEGPGLVFKTMPVLFGKLSGGTFLSIVFFTVLVFTAITSSISLLEVLVANSIERLNWSRKQSSVVIGIAAFLFGIPCALSGSETIFPSWKLMYGKDFFSTISNTPDVLMPMGGFFIAVFVGWFLDKKLVREEFCRGTKVVYLFPIWYFLIRWIAPLSILLIMLYQNDSSSLEMQENSHSFLERLWRMLKS